MGKVYYSHHLGFNLHGDLCRMRGQCVVCLFWIVDRLKCPLSSPFIRLQAIVMIILESDTWCQYGPLKSTGLSIWAIWGF